MTAAVTRADNRRTTYQRRIAAAVTERAKAHALVWWWLSEWKKLPPAEQRAAFVRMEDATSELNERSRS